jgi:hypothetical protein
MDNRFVEPLAVEAHSAPPSHPQLALPLIRAALSAARAIARNTGASGFRKRLQQPTK